MKRQKASSAIVGSLLISGLGYVGAVRLAEGQPLPPYVEGQQGPAGGMGGDRCSASDVPREWQLASINVRSSVWIDAIELTFKAPGAPEPPAPIRCGGTGGEPGRLLTLDPGEFIVRIMGKYGLPRGKSVYDAVVISYLYVQTSNGKIREFGNGKAPGIFFDYQAIDGTAIAGFIIRAHTYVDAVGVVLRKRP